MSKLSDHIGSPAHPADLFQTEKLSRLHLDIAPSIRVGDVDVRHNSVSVQHHLPAKAMFHVKPFDPAVVNEIAQRNQHLDCDINRRQAQEQRLFPSRGKFSAFWRRYSEAWPKECQNASRPTLVGASAPKNLR
jgi:hypothetical protein